MGRLMSMPIHSWPLSLSTSPLRPEPQPMSSKRHSSSSGSASSSRARSAKPAWICTMWELKVDLDSGRSLVKSLTWTSTSLLQCHHRTKKRTVKIEAGCGFTSSGGPECSGRRPAIFGKPLCRLRQLASVETQCLLLSLVFEFAAPLAFRLLIGLRSSTSVFVRISGAKLVLLKPTFHSFSISTH